jgi:hypothetical protein
MFLSGKSVIVFLFNCGQCGRKRFPQKLESSHRRRNVTKIDLE